MFLVHILVFILTFVVAIPIGLLIGMILAVSEEKPKTIKVKKELFNEKEFIERLEACRDSFAMSIDVANCVPAKRPEENHEEIN
jgi:hypothetical protein